MNKTTTRNKHSEYDLSNDWENIIDKLIETKDTIADAASDVKGVARETLKQSVDNFKDKSLDARDNVENFIQERPFKTVGAALIIGLVMGYLFHK